MRPQNKKDFNFLLAEILFRDYFGNDCHVFILDFFNPDVAEFYGVAVPLQFNRDGLFAQVF